MTPSSRSAAHPGFTAKLAHPVANPAQVLRQTLVDRIGTAHGCKLTLIRAPAGSGKTTLMEQCRRSFEDAGIATAWLNLEASDNDISRFLSCLMEATNQLSDDPVALPLSEAPTARPIGDTILHVLARLSQCRRPYVLILDEFEHIQHLTVLDVIRELINQMPPQGRLVMASRITPDLPLSRMRARGQLLEIDAHNLRFSLEETTTFLTDHRQLALSSEELSMLQQRTEGWVAALWLASLALERQEDHRRFIEGFSGSHDTIAQYLTESVLARQAPHIRHFLLRTSILKQLSAPLCQALVPEVDADGLLRELESADILLTPVEGVERWYRYHSLFSDFLQSHLAREAPDELPRLHRLASQWYSEQGRPIPAIDHALAGADFPLAVSLLLEHAMPVLADGRMRLLARWCASLPPELLCQHPQLQVAQLWAVAYSRGADAATALMVSYGLDRIGHGELQGYMMPLQGLLLSMMDRVEDALIIARQCVAQLNASPSLADGVLLCTVASIHLSAGDFDGARPLLEAARCAQGDRLAGFTVMYSESAEGVIDLYEGRLRQARARIKMALAASREGRRRESNGNAWAGVLYACAIYECDELNAAENLLRAYTPLVHDLGLADLMILVHVTLARVDFQRGDVDRAFQTLTDLEYLGRQRKLTRVVASAKLERARVLLLQGHARAAREELDRAEDAALWERIAGRRLIANEVEDMALGRLRWEVAAGDAEACLPWLERAIADATVASRHLRAFKLELLYAMALSRCGQLRARNMALGKLLRQTCQEGFMRVIVDEGPHAGLMVSEYAAAVRKDNTRGADPIFAEYLQRLHNAFGLSGADTSAASGPETTVQEPLSRKEIGVLQLVADGYSDVVIAEKLFVSASTVRTHLRNIYIKLDVHSRMQAVLAARRSGVI